MARPNPKRRAARGASSWAAGIFVSRNPPRDIAAPLSAMDKLAALLSSPPLPPPPSSPIHASAERAECSAVANGPEQARQWETAKANASAARASANMSGICSGLRSDMRTIINNRQVCHICTRTCKRCGDAHSGKMAAHNDCGPEMWRALFLDRSSCSASDGARNVDVDPLNFLRRTNQPHAVINRHEAEKSFCGVVRRGRARGTREKESRDGESACDNSH